MHTEEDAKKLTCGNCKFGIFQDYGYSNYTVEGTNFRCARRLHPDGEFDRFYGEDKRLEFASRCDAFETGDAVEMDVEREALEEGGLSPEQRLIWAMDQEAKA